VNPLTSAYGALVGGKNRLYDRGVLKAQRLRGPVISVGNLSVGGSGKTPFVILLGHLLQQRGIEFDVLSRGYGRRTRGVLGVDPNGLPDQFGDEPLLIARRLGCPVILGERRYDAGLFAERKYSSRLHLLDDGFQHRALARDFDLVLLTQEDLRDRLLPSGRLREPMSSLNRANALVLMNDLEFTPPPGKTVWRVRRSLEIYSPPSRPIAFCGIARPHQFIEQLRESGIDPVATKFYRDHHAYTQSDLQYLREMGKRTGATGFITTEKDEVNLGPRIESLGNVCTAKVRMELADSPDVLDTILRVIGNHEPAA